MTRRDAEPEGVWYACPRTGKRGYPTRADARKARVRTRGNRNGLAAEKDGALSIYRCDDDEHGPGCTRFHIGHLPRRVVRGEVTRDEVYRKPPRDTPKA